jgi:hypothetical protein
MLVRSDMELTFYDLSPNSLHFGRFTISIIIMFTINTKIYLLDTLWQSSGYSVVLCGILLLNWEFSRCFLYINNISGRIRETVMGGGGAAPYFVR